MITIRRAHVSFCFVLFGFFFFFLKKKQITNLNFSKVDDLLAMQAANLMSLPENYAMKYYFYHLLTWPHLSQVATDHKVKENDQNYSG